MAETLRERFEAWLDGLFEGRDRGKVRIVLAASRREADEARER